MRIQEISDEVAERLKLEESKNNGKISESPVAPADPPNEAPQSTVPIAGPELSPGRSEKKSLDEVVAELKKTPFFMTELEENDETEAFKALAYEGTPLENGTDFKERGNECFKAKQWNDAKEFYTKGILILAAEERARKKAAETATASSSTAPSPPPQTQNPESKPNPQKARGETPELSPEEEIAQQRAVLESLYVNRAACNLELKNYRSAWLDGSAALRLNPKNVKAYYRSARAFLAVGRLTEADDACAAGLALDESNNALRAVARDIISKAQAADAKHKKEAEQQAREARRAALIKAALRARGIRTRTTAQPPEMEDAGLKLVPDPDDPASALSFPVVLLYPLHYESDFIKAVAETQSLGEHLAYVFPLPWDKEGVYSMANVELYVETVGGGMLKVGKKAPLLKVLSGGRVEVVDEVLKVFVLPSAKAAEWVSDFKMKRAAEKGAT